MTEIFVKLLNMSIAASWLVAAVLLLRLLLKRAPKWITCVLWAIVALRLILPFYVESHFSLIPSAEVIPQDIVTSQTPAIHSGIPAVNSVVNPAVARHTMEQENVLENVLSAAAWVWAVGAVAMVLYGVVSWLLLHRRVNASILLRENIYLCDNVDSPFVFGFSVRGSISPPGWRSSSLPMCLPTKRPISAGETTAGSP